MKNKTKIYGNRSYYACLYFQIWFGAVFQNVPAVTSRLNPDQSWRGTDGKRQLIPKKN